jgi:hypothetical protein
MTIRPFRDQDRGPVLTFLGDPRAIDSPSNHIHVAEENGTIVGAVIWTQPDAGDEALLGAVIAPPGRLDLFYSLVRSTAEDALARGFKQATFTIRKPGLLALLQRDFTISPQPAAWNPHTHKPVQWRIAVDLPDALRQLAQVL